MMKNGKYLVESVIVKLSNGETVELNGNRQAFYRVSDNYVRYNDRPMKDWPHFKEHEVRWTSPLS